MSITAPSSVLVVSLSPERSETLLSKPLNSLVLYLASCDFMVTLILFSCVVFSYTATASASSVSSVAKFLVKSDSHTSKMSMIEPPAPDAAECFSGAAGCCMKASKLLCTNAVHRGLLLSKGCQFGAQYFDFFLQLRRLCCGQVNLGGKLRHLSVQPRFLCFGFSEFFIAICLLCGLRFCLAFELTDHIIDQALHFGKNVITTSRTVADHGTDAGCKLGKSCRVVLLGKLFHQAYNLYIGKIRSSLQLRSNLDERV